MIRQLVILVGLSFSILSAVSGQELIQDDLSKLPQWQRVLHGTEEKRADELTQKIENCQLQSDYKNAIQPARELYELRKRLQGDQHFDTIIEKWKLHDMTILASLPESRRAQWIERIRGEIKAFDLEDSGRYIEATVKRNEMLEECRKVYGEEHPFTSMIYANLASNHTAQGKHGDAESFGRKALTIRQKTLGEHHPNTALAYHNLAAILDDQAKYTEAEVLYKKALVICHEALGQNRSETEVVSGRLARNLESQKKYAEAEPLYTIVLTVRRSTFGEDDLNTANSYNDLGVNLINQRKYSDGESFLRKAIAIRKRAWGEDHVKRLTIYDDLIVSLQEQNKFEEAEVLCRKTLAMRLRVFGDNQVQTAQSYKRLALALGGQGRYEDAEILLKKVLAINCRLLNEDDPELSASYHNLGTNQTDQGRFADADILLTKALNIREKVLGENHLDTAASCDALGTNLTAQQKLVEAALPLFRSLAIRTKILGVDHYDMGLSYNNLAVNMHERGLYELANTFYSMAITVTANAKIKHDVRLAMFWNNLAVNCVSRKKFADANHAASHALTILTECLGKYHPYIGISIMNLSGRYFAEKHYKEAETHLKIALKINTKALGREHPVTATNCNILARNYFAEGLLTESLAMLNQGRFSFEASRLLSIGRGVDRFQLEDRANPYNLLSIVHARQRAFYQAYEALETNRARGLLDEIANRRGSTLTEDEEHERQKLSERRATIQARISALLVEQNDVKDIESEAEPLLSERAENGEKLALLAVSLSSREVATVKEIQKALKRDEALLTWIDETTHEGGINEHWACVLRSSGEPIFEELKGDGANSAFSADDIELPEKLRMMLWNRNSSEKEIKSDAKRLYEQRFAAIEKHLHGIAKIYIVAVDVMAGIPVDVLTDRVSVSYVQSGTSLARMVDKRPVKSVGVLAVGDPVYNVDSVLKRRSVQVPPGGILIQSIVPGGNAEKDGRLQIGDVLLTYSGVKLLSIDDFDKACLERRNVDSVEITVWRAGQTNLNTFEMPSGKLGVVFAKEPAPDVIARRLKTAEPLAILDKAVVWKNLPGTRRELKSLEELFKGQVKVLAGKFARESEIEKLRENDALSEFRYLHFATHGAGDDSRAFNSALILSQDEPKSQENAPEGKPWIDGEITAREVLTFWKLNADLVTLSACQTGFGRRGGGDGPLGFAQAFLLAGSRSVCLSLWEVDDSATALLMDRFYRNLLGRRAGLAKQMSKSDALAEAKKWLRSLKQDEVAQRLVELSDGVVRGKGESAFKVERPGAGLKSDSLSEKPFDNPHIWGAYILIGDSN